VVTPGSTRRSPPAASRATSTRCAVCMLLQGYHFMCSFYATRLDTIVSLSMDPCTEPELAVGSRTNYSDVLFGHSGGQHRDGLPAARQPACGAPTPGRRATRRRRLCHHLHGEGEPLLQSSVLSDKWTASLFTRGSADYWPRLQLRDHRCSAQAECGRPAAGEEHCYLWTSSQAESSVTVHILHDITSRRRYAVDPASPRLLKAQHGTLLHCVSRNAFDHGHECCVPRYRAGLCQFAE